MNRSSRAPAPRLVELTATDLEAVSGGGASWGTCFRGGSFGGGGSYDAGASYGD